jgi:3-deoxy-manno-octulosonate cytidylyltransferase (CMP-KDO synthetase)
MIRRVWEQVNLIPGSEVIIATEDERIREHAETFGARVIMTSPDHQSGTDRCAEVLEKINSEYDIVVNVQGDEPFIKPEQLQELLSCFDHRATDIATLIKEVPYDDEYKNPNLVKCLINKNKEAIYFSRFPVPFIRNEKPEGKFYKHIGLYAYRPQVLKVITKLPQSFLEKSESLEQLRWLENGYRIRVETTKYDSISIDTPDDLIK